MITVNGARLQDAQGQTVAALLKKQNFHPERVVVERNREIVSKSMYDSTVLCERDSIEILQFVGGG